MANSVEELIELIIIKINKLPYMWFRFTWSTINEETGIWTVWAEGASKYTGLMAYDRYLINALTQFWEMIKDG